MNESSQPRNSLDHFVMQGWRWQPFLDHAITALKPYEPRPYPVANEFLHQQTLSGSKSKPVSVTTRTWACSTRYLRQVRAACVEATPAAAVLNFVINPSSEYDLPFFGADLVTLPSGHLIALDLQPALKTDYVHTRQVWQRLVPLYEKWQQPLPEGGPIPEEAQPFFSPGFLWTRIPLGNAGDQLIAEAVMPAFVDYLDLFLSLLVGAQPVDASRQAELLAGQQRYTAYRAAKDPARGMLGRFYGREWTERYIHEVLFDL